MEEQIDWTEKLKKISDYEYMIDKEGKMNVPVRIFASEKMLEKIRVDALPTGIKTCGVI